MSRISFVCFFLLFTATLPGQDTYSLNGQTEISIDGTSTLHDWTMTMEEGKSSGSAVFMMDGDAIENLKSLRIALESKGLKSGKAAMDNNAYKALKTDEYPEIVFVMKKVNEVEKSEAGYKVDVAGDLTIAGATREIVFSADCVVDDGQVRCSGSKPILMTDFDIKPPSVMLGTVKTGDEITINYKTVFSK